MCINDLMVWCRRTENNPSQTLKKPQDFDDGANDLWSLYGKEAQIYDEPRIKTLKDDVGSVLIFVCVFFPSGWPEF